MREYYDISSGFVNVKELNLNSFWLKQTHEAIDLLHFVDNLNVQTLIKLPHSDRTGDIVVITSGNITNSISELKTVANIVKQRQFQFNVIVYPYKNVTDISRLTSLVSWVNGKIFLIPSSDSEVAAVMKFHDAFDNLIPATDVLVHRQEFPHNQREINFEMEVDSFIDQDSKLVAQLHHSSKSEDLFGPTLYLNKIGGNKKLTPKSNGIELSNGIIVPVNSHDIGTWNLHYERLTNDSVMYGVAYIRNPKKHSNLITAKCILSEATEDLPPAVHVLVSTNGHLKLVQNAYVEVTLIRNDGTTVLERRPLVDDGLANPDITQGDGIYSQYLPEANQVGLYEVLVQVKSTISTKLHEGSRGENVNCCGSTVPQSTFETQSKVQHLQRMVNCGFLHVKKSFEPENRVYRISDLKVVGVSQPLREVTVNFTLPQSLLKSTTVRVFKNSQYHQIREFDVGLELASPLTPSGHDLSSLTQTSKVPGFEGGIYHLAIKVKGTNSNSNSISNIVTFFIRADPSTLTTEGKHFFHFSLLFL